MLKTILKFLLLPGLLASQAVFAEDLFEIQLAGKPIINVDHGYIGMCGVRVIGVKVSELPDQSSDGIDFTFSLNAQGGTVKVATYDVSIISKRKTQKPRIVPIKSAWIRTSDGEAAIPLDGKFHANPEAAGSILYDASIYSIVSLFDALHTGDRVQIGIQRTHENKNRVYSGIVKMKDSDQTQIAGCLDDLVKGIASSATNNHP